MAVLNITYQGLSADYPLDVDMNLTDRDVRRIAVEVVRLLHERAGLPLRMVKDLPMAEMGAFRAPRPRHTAMATGKLEALLGRPPRDWREALRLHLESGLLSR